MRRKLKFALDRLSEFVIFVLTLGAALAALIYFLPFD